VFWALDGQGTDAVGGPRAEKAKKSPLPNDKKTVEQGEKVVK